MQYMAELPGIFHRLKKLKHQIVSDHIHSTDFDLLERAQFDIYSPLDPPCRRYGKPKSLDNARPTEASCSVRDNKCSHLALQTMFLSRAKDLKNTLYALGHHMNEKLTNGTTISELPSTEENSPILTTYHFKKWRDMTAYNCFWSVLIMTNKVIMQLLPPFDPAIYDLQRECRSVALEICKTWEDAWASKPIGAFHTGLSFVVAFEYCTPDVQEWIVRGLNSLLDYQMVDAFRWSDEVVAMMSSKLAGEGPDLVFSNVNLSKEAQ